MLDSLTNDRCGVGTLAQQTTATHAVDEIERGVRFAFGKNWQSFLESVDEERIAAAMDSLTTMLGRSRLDDVRFLDIGSGSGLFSLAAHRMGASVTSFDFDPESVACTLELRRRYQADGPSWDVAEGSVLDPEFMRSLDKHDIVYAWGVLHHTGEMWRGMEHSIGAVAPGGLLFIAIYNDQGHASRIWRRIKLRYNRAGPIGRWVLMLLASMYFGARRVLGRRGRGASRARGMSAAHDLRDWLGGYPFEVATPGAVFDFCRMRGLTLESLTTRSGIGNNEFVFRRST
jgi:2-polyprenyl-3-methyl-5-hydroxy-6-metoxy-1,4-benzoquinol methylase